MKIIKFFFIAVVFCLITFSCEKDKEEDNQPITERLILKTETENLNNDQDRMGQLHNDYLDFFISRYDGQTTVNRRYLLEITKEFYDRNNLTYNEEEIVAVFDIFRRMEADNVDLEVAINTQSSTICDYIPLLCDIGDTGPYNPYPFPDFNFSTSGSNTDKVLDFINRTKRLENEVLNSDEYNEEQKYIISHYLATARYSHQYWHNQEVLGNESPWAAYMDEIKLAQDCPACKDDVAGAIGGAIGGGPAGALAGAVGASAASIIVDWIW